MRKVMAFGTFDLLHPGHLHYLNQAKKLGNRLIVVVTTDKNAEKVKGKPPINAQQHRLELVNSLKPVDEAILGEENDFFMVVEEKKPDIIALGYDQAEQHEWVEKELKKRGLKVKVVRLEPLEEGKHKVSKIKEKIAKEFT
ncbi:MAG: FAD synthase [Candidatus Diapherotrites archaeon]|uniref:FAD synthase n=1 Tax=Candidatus Iainarchaeum sp. TaxID=3101447 RepID=A0A7J4ITR7_9ARCH|nr:MAG: FAD synthetase [archaeon GW2011_AR10]MBS3059081.1 FAD synthase [Candidatus Diapherotrites archaeon]HIH08842.1 FAD synthase [Candidatus Diapherotrites archaeon]